MVFMVTLMLAFLAGTQGFASGSPSSGHGSGDAHGGGGGEKKKTKYVPYSMTGAEKCVVPATHNKPAPVCGTPQYEVYVNDVEKYNQCVDPFKSKQLLTLRPCRMKPKPKQSVEKMADKLLDVP